MVCVVKAIELIRACPIRIRVESQRIICNTACGRINRQIFAIMIDQASTVIGRERPYHIIYRCTDNRTGINSCYISRSCILVFDRLNRVDTIAGIVAAAEIECLVRIGGFRVIVHDQPGIPIAVHIADQILFIIFDCIRRFPIYLVIVADHCSRRGIRNSDVVNIQIELIRGAMVSDGNIDVFTLKTGRNRTGSFRIGTCCCSFCYLNTIILDRIST